ncbi:hypothetical protein RhiirA4_482799 [Rhizophagus irregularis]|uniref:Uncharacterized protein n=1 Tax=Rhizophagus irregularis TaxID=588596 RepID=A0A2I1HLL0_9GLOM|nr:hypothetical protein RhiirA4_482799 [Rhizophagus irregularis]
MSRQLLIADCLNYFPQEDYSYGFKSHVSLSIISTLITCLHKESKDLLQKEEFFIINLTQTRKPPLFNYPSFIKVITIRGIKRMIQNFPFDTKDFDSLHCIRIRELSRPIQNRSWSIKSNFPQEDYDSYGFKSRVSLSIISTLITFLPKESKDLLQKEEFFIINLTQTRKPSLFNYPSFIKVITIRGIKRMIRNFPFDTKDFDSLHCIRMRRCILQELLKMLMNQVTSLKTLDYYYIEYYFKSIYPLGSKILEINGKNLIDLYIPENPDNSLNLAIAKFYPNLSIVFEENETFKLILNNCQYLEIIRLQYNAERCSNIKTFFRVLTRYVQKDFYKLTINWGFLNGFLSFEKICKRTRGIFYKLERSYTTKITFTS